MNDLVEQKQKLMDVLGTTNVEIKNWDEIVTTNPETISYPVADFATIGTTFAELSSILLGASKIAESKHYFEAVIPHGLHLAEAKNGSGLLGALIRDGKGVVGQARFKEVDVDFQSAEKAGNLFMAMALMAINQSLKDIVKNQQKIISFLEVEKQTSLKGDMITLTNIINEYGHNWNNSLFLRNREMQVLDIKRSAEQNILFYREMIEKVLAKQQFICMDAAKKLGEIQSDFQYYQLSVYQYSFSSFLDVILLENFDKQYLNSVSQKINDYSHDYSLFFDKTITDIENLAGSSVQSRALQGLSIAGKFVGKQIGKIPGKDKKITLDSKLISGSEKLDEIHDKSITETKEQFSVVQDSGICLFYDKVNLLNAMYNEPLKITIGQDKVFLTVV